eukprot:TRINITY_DN9712_c0_g1_i5.p2 TRINITY_DN9712_c0_g1~~TRINITY_DN9712_c0_g1_i5.p2  ORF type:complete len:215 (-),score=22.81 TRINITY_DN9712_c0_g1_i5:153-797(-)
MCRVTFVLALFHVLLSYAVCGPGYVVELTNKNFEHQTQAATGQTTGRWYVFFFEPGRGACIRLLKQWETLAIHNEMDDVIFAKVDIQRSPELKERFKIEQTPHVVLFRDRAMYTYKGPVIGNQADKYLQSFYREDYEKMIEEDVPEPLSQLQGYFQNMKFEHKSVRMYILFGGLFLLFILACVMLYIKYISRQAKQTEEWVEVQMKDPVTKKEE